MSTQHPQDSVGDTLERLSVSIEDLERWGKDQRFVNYSGRVMEEFGGQVLRILKLQKDVLVLLDHELSKRQGSA